ncbi:MAG TPA: hypothetical protein VF530_18280 [Planctomycetota bacterium]
MTSTETSPDPATAIPPGEAPASSNGGAAPRTDPADATAFEAVLARLAERGAEILAEVRALLRLRAEESRLRWRRLRWALARVLLAGTAAAALAVAGAVYLARGLAHALAAAWPERPWLGELLAGAILLALVAAGVALARAREEQRELERLRRTLGQDERKGTDGETDHGDRHGPGTDGGAAPGGRAGTREGAPRP